MSERYYKVRTCPIANAEHKKSLRQYAHVFHYDGVICVARAWYSLPSVWRFGVLMHEIGHLLIGPRGSESQATEFASHSSGIRIKYVDGIYGERLERIPEDDVLLARVWLKSFVGSRPLGRGY